MRAAALLLPADLRLRVVEGYRCAADQLAIEAAYRLVVSKEHPSADTAEIERLTSRFVAPLEVAGHVAGAAVDLFHVGGPGLRVHRHHHVGAAAGAEMAGLAHRGAVSYTHLTLPTSDLV